MFYWVAKTSKFPTDKWRFDNIDPHSSVAISKCNVSLLIYCQQSVIIHGVSAYERV